MADCKDLLVEMAKTRDIIFMTKRWNPKMAYNYGNKLTVKELRPLVCGSSRIHQVIKKISEEQQISKRNLYARVRAYLDEMGHNRNMTIIRWVGLALCKILRKNYCGIIVNENSMLSAKTTMGPNPVIFAPSHRSYADFILMSFLCYFYDIEIPAIAAGMDFKGMWMVGEILRDCCAFFIKRTFGGDELYKATFHEYIASLVSCGESALEFFIEGTRSRSGKSLPPKFGLLTAALEQYFIGKVPDVTIIPVSISYERILEEKLFASELLGVPKPKESTRLLFKALKFLKDNYGHIFVEFGRPISVQEFCGQYLSEDPRVIVSQKNNLYQTSYVTPDIENVLRHLGYEIINAHNRSLKYTSVNLFAASMSVAILYNDEISLCHIFEDMEALRIVLHHFEIPEIPEVVLKDILHCFKIHQHFLLYDERKKTVQLQNFSHVSYNVEDSALRGHRLLNSTLSQVYPVMLLQQYANPVCLKCCHLSIMMIIIYTSADNIIHRDVLFNEYKYLRDLLSLEFVLMSSEDRKEHDFNNTISILNKLDLIKSKAGNPDYFILKKSDSNGAYRVRDNLLMGIVFPFIQGYWMTIKECCQHASENLSNVKEKEFHKQIQRSIEVSMPGCALHGYALSLEVLTNAVNMFVSMNAIQRIKLPQGGTELCILLDNCFPIMKKLDCLTSYVWGILEESVRVVSQNPQLKCNL